MKTCFLLLMTLVPQWIYSFPADCQVYFSHQEKLEERLIEWMEREKQSIHVASFCLTHVGIAKALIRAKERGVLVEVLVDPFSIKKRSSIHHLLKANIPLFVWDQQSKMAPKKGKAKMHNNFCIFGDSVVWTGSFNPTVNAKSRNQENVVVLKSQEVAKQYKETFLHLKQEESLAYQEFLSLNQKKKGSDKKSRAEYISARSTEVKK